MVDRGRRHFVRSSGAIATLAGLGLAGRAGAQGAPLETVKIVTGFPPGGTSDTPIQIWNQMNFGENLLYGPRGGGLYYWTAGSGLTSRGVNLADIPSSEGFQRIAAIDKIKNAINENDETRKRFEIMAREVFNTNWIKLELIGDDYTLQPDTLNLPEAASRLIKAGFKVLPYCTEDLVLCQRLVDVGCQAVMPWAAPIGTGKGPVNPTALRTLRERLDVPLIVDAGLGLPSHACQVMEWGYDAVLLNTAVALAQDPIAMAGAFAQAVKAGRNAYLSGAMQAQDAAQPSTPVLGTPFWHNA